MAETPVTPHLTEEPVSAGSLDPTDLATVPSPISLSDDQKYQVLTTIPSKLKEYPLNHQKRRYHPYWTEQFPWVRYSASLDGVFCAPCFLFGRAHFNSEFVSSPFRNWKNATGTSRGALNRHSLSQTHQECVEQAASFIAVMEKNQQSIKSQLSAAYDNQVQLNTRALLSIIDCIQFLVKQGLGLRGSNWDKGAKKEDGNFTSLLDFVSKYSADLKSHLHSSPKNARYLSPKIQNEFITINGDLIRKSIVDECNASLYWSVMADETTDVSTTEQVSICVRYIRENRAGVLEVCEEFLGFCSVPTADAETITSAIDAFASGCGLNMAHLVGKGFDGAATMSGCVSGVSARLQQLHPNAKYFTHCRNHALNLVIVASCQSVPDVRNFMNTLKELTLFFKYSAKRKQILHQHLKTSHEDFLADCGDSEVVPKKKYQGLPVMSDTRWLTRVDSIHCLLQNYRALCEAVEEVRNRSSGDSASDADSFLKRLLSFEFLASAIICQHVLQYTRPLTVALQAKECDLYKAHRMAQRLMTALSRERTAEKFHSLWEAITEISSDLELEPMKKRTVRKQQHRSNPPAEDTEGHYRVAYYYAFLDHTMTHLKTRFPPELEGALLATYLLPANIANLSEELLSKLKEEFADFLPHPSSFISEVSTWKVHMAEAEDDKRNLLAMCSFANNNRLFYPNIHSVLLLLLSLPVGSCSCERSFSALRRLKTWCRNSMSDERLDSLALGYINQERSFTPEEILQVWDRSGHRRIALAFKDN